MSHPAEYTIDVIDADLKDIQETMGSLRRQLQAPRFVVHRGIASAADGHLTEARKLLAELAQFIQHTEEK